MYYRRSYRRPARSFYRPAARVIVRKPKYYGYTRGYRGRRRLWVARRVVRVVHRYDRRRSSYPLRRIVREGDSKSAVKYVARQMKHLDLYRQRMHKAVARHAEKSASQSTRSSSGPMSQYEAQAEQYLSQGMPQSQPSQPYSQPNVAAGGVQADPNFGKRSHEEMRAGGFMTSTPALSAGALQNGGVSMSQEGMYD